MITADTHVIIWDALRSDLMSNTAKREFEFANNSDGIIFCDISFWEIAMLIQKKRLEIDISYMEFIDLVKTSNHYIYQSITPEIAELSTILATNINSDPADRIIAATSVLMNAPLVTADTNLRKSKDIKTIW